MTAPLLSNSPPSQESSSDTELARALEEFIAALEAGSPPSIEDLVAQHPRIADRLRTCLDSLRFVERAASSVGPGAEADSTTGLGVLGDFRILREIGRGGMGVVYEAEQISLGRRVALKVLPFAAMLDERQLRRFKNEAHAAAVLKHPHIVSVHGIGCERSVHFYAMELIEGHSLAEVIANLRATTENVLGATAGEHSPRGATAGLSSSASDEATAGSTVALAALPTELSRPGSRRFRAAAELAIQAAEALAYAHREGIIHRDIKPSNLLLDRDGKLWVTDFGLAHLPSGGDLTLTGDVLGTLRYMSPEQLAGDKVVDQRTDVYSLGLTLYELLAGRPAFTDDRREQLVRRILESDPPPLRKLDPAIPRDLETIILRATAKDRDARYQTAQDLADDLRRYLDAKPIRARRATTVQRLRYWCRRNPAVATLTACVAGLLVFLSIAGPLSAIRESKLRTAAELSQQATLETLYVQDMHAVNQAWEEGNVDEMGHLLSRHTPQPGQTDLRGFEWRHFWGRYQHALAVPRWRHDCAILSVAYSPDGSIIAAPDYEGQAPTGSYVIRLLDPRTRRPLGTLRGARDAVQSLAFSPDGRRLFAGEMGGALQVWDVDQRYLLKTLETQSFRLSSVAISSEGSLLAAATPEGVIHFWDMLTFGPMASIPAHPDTVNRVAFSPDGRTIASASDDRTVKLWDVGSREERATFTGHATPVLDVAFSHDGALLASVSRDGDLRLWDAATQEEVWKFSLPAGSNQRLAFSHDDALLATNGSGRLIKLWDVATGTPRATMTGHTGLIVSLAFSPDDRWLTSGGEDKRLLLWEVPPAPPPRKSSHTNWMTRLAFSANGNLLAVSEAELGSPQDKEPRAGALRIWNRRSNEWTTLPSPSSAIQCGAFSPSGALLATSMGNWKHGENILWDMSTLRRVDSLRDYPHAVTALSFSPDGRLLATGSFPWTSDGEILLWDVETRRSIRRLEPKSMVMTLAFSNDGQTLAAAVGQWDQGGVQLWDVPSGRLSKLLPLDAQMAVKVVYSPDGRWLAAGGWHGAVVVWDTVTHNRRHTLSGHTSSATSVAFSPDSRTLASAGLDNTVRLWHLGTGGEMTAWRTPHEVMSLAFSPDSQLLVAALSDRSLVMWRSDGGMETVDPR